MFSPDQIIDIQQRHADGYQMRAIVTHYGMDPHVNAHYDAVFNICHRRRRYRGLSSPTPWEPTCMPEREYAEWRDLTQRMAGPYERPVRPCDDCPALWAQARRDEGRCNGTLPEERVRAEATA